MANDAPIRRENSQNKCGRLIVLEDGMRTDLLTPFDNSTFFSIDFPAMPEQIELARQAEYRVLTNMVVPDGVHQYMRTQPLEIPFEFKLHWQDKDYCKDGALTILNLAARLHALVTPLGDSNLSVTVQNDGALNDDGTSNPSAASPNNDANKVAKAGQNSASQGSNQQSTTSASATFTSDSTNKVDPPVACRLELMYTTTDGPGVVCNGYVKNVKAVLLQPWLRGPSGSFNLPSAGIFSFTFVHRPGHGNWYSNKNNVAAVTQQAQAYADLIKNRLYNTRMLQTSSQYRGFARTTS